MSLSKAQTAIVKERIKINKSWDRAQETIKNCRERLRELQKNCRHDGGNTFRGDPSGGNGSWYKCILCGGKA